MTRILLLSCCAPCSCAVIERLHSTGADFAVLFYNPNISPLDEYEKRLDENKRLCKQLGVEFIELEYDAAAWAEDIKGLEQEPERGKRCFACFKHRLKKTALYAKEQGFDCFSSVLGVSRYKDLEQVNRAAAEAAAEAGLKYLDTNWRKGGLEERRAAMSKELALYSQDYCGCVSSRKGNK